MPGFRRSRTDLTVYRIHNTECVTFDKLKKHAFQPIDNLKTEDFSRGWTNLDDMLDTGWATSVPEKGEWLCFCYRQDKRTIPGAVLKKLYAEALKEERSAATAEQKTVSRKRKAELKELIRLRLLPTIQPAPTLVDVAMNMHSGLLLVGTSVKGVLANFEELMGSSFGLAPVKCEPGADVQQKLRALFSDGLTAAISDRSFTLADAGQVVLAGSIGEDDVQVVVKNDKASAAAGLESGLSIAKLKIQLQRNDGLVWTFKLSTDLTFSGFCAPATEASGHDDAALLEKLYLLEHGVEAVFAAFSVK